MYTFKLFAFLFTKNSIILKGVVPYNLQLFKNKTKKNKREKKVIHTDVYL